MMKICVSLRSRIKVSSRSIVKILDTFNEVYDNVFGNLPCANTIDLWTRKCGLDTYNENVQKLSDIKYCEIIDESMMIGSNKLVISLAAPSQHQNHPLSHSDVSIVNITTAESFNAQKICDALNEVTSKVGHAPEYVITDNASAMTKGVSLANCHNHLDISHSLATFLERTYKNEPDFQEYLKDMTNIQFQHNMKHIAYILPPKQRTIARFMNIKNWINWSSCVLEKYSFLGNKEKEILRFIPTNASLIQELSEVISVIYFVENEFKQNGLSIYHVNQCIEHIKKTLLKGSHRMHKLACLIIEYMKKEVSWLSIKDKHNNSSDVIESLYGIYKHMKSPNKLYGVTSLVLHLPVYQALSIKGALSSYNFKERIENIKKKQLNEWSKNNLPQNLVCKRIKALSTGSFF